MASLDASTGTVPHGSTDLWRDRKRYLWLLGLVVPCLAFAALALHGLTGWGMWYWLGPLVILGLVPAIDLLAGLDRSNPPDDLIQALEQDRYYRWITYLYLPIQYAGFITAFWVISHGQLATVDKVGLVPPLWRRVMDRRVLAHFDGDMSRANINPRSRARVLARYVGPDRLSEAAGSSPPPEPSRPQITDEPVGTAGGVVAVARCPGCGYVYDAACGEPREGFPAGTPWSAVPDTWCCPDCGVREKVGFQPIREVAAG